MLLQAGDVNTGASDDFEALIPIPRRYGFAFVAETEAHRASMSYHASYLSHQSEARGFASYAAMRELGREGIRELVERNCDCARQILEGLSRLENVEVLSRPMINQGLVTFLDPSGKPSDEWNDRMIRAIANWQTCGDDVRRTLKGVERARKQMRETATLAT